ncbi:hypothetical protein D3C73_1654550 [compost metagenome]
MNGSAWSCFLHITAENRQCLVARLDLPNNAVIRLLKQILYGSHRNHFPMGDDCHTVAHQLDFA